MSKLTSVLDWVLDFHDSMWLTFVDYLLGLEIFKGVDVFYFVQAQIIVIMLVRDPIGFSIIVIFFIPSFDLFAS